MKSFTNDKAYPLAAGREYKVVLTVRTDPIPGMMHNPEDIVPILFQNLYVQSAEVHPTLPRCVGEVESNPTKFGLDVEHDHDWQEILTERGFKFPTLLEVLTSARAAIELYGHTKGAFGRMEDETELGDSFKDLNRASCFCTLGALYYRNGRYLNPNVSRARNLLAALLNEDPSLTTSVFIPAWNDAPERTKEDVLELYSRAIARCQEPDFDPSILD